MKTNFTVPLVTESSRVRVEYMETLFMGQPCKPYLRTTPPVDNPGTTTGIQALMLARHVGLGHIVAVVPVAPPKEISRPSPAEHKVVQYMRQAER
jgi:hypothetical protein